MPENAMIFKSIKYIDKSLGISIYFYFSQFFLSRIALRFSSYPWRPPLQCWHLSHAIMRHNLITMARRREIILVNVTGQSCRFPLANIMPDSIFLENMWQGITGFVVFVGFFCGVCLLCFACFAVITDLCLFYCVVWWFCFPWNASDGISFKTIAPTGVGKSQAARLGR